MLLTNPNQLSRFPAWHAKKRAICDLFGVDVSQLYVYFNSDGRPLAISVYIANFRERHTNMEIFFICSDM